jgi:hypothetical protein
MLSVAALQVACCNVVVTVATVPWRRAAGALRRAVADRARRGALLIAIIHAPHKRLQTFTHTHPHAHARTHPNPTHTHISQTHTRAQTSRTHTHAHTHAHAPTHTHAHTRTHAHMHARTHTRTHADTHFTIAALQPPSAAVAFCIPRPARRCDAVAPVAAMPRELDLRAWLQRTCGRIVNARAVCLRVSGSPAALSGSVPRRKLEGTEPKWEGRAPLTVGNAKRVAPQALRALWST